MSFAATYFLFSSCIYVLLGSIVNQLFNIYNLSLKSAVFPDVWKTAKVKPLYKKWDKCDMRKYRPISLIPIFAKLVERPILIG